MRFPKFIPTLTLSSEEEAQLVMSILSQSSCDCIEVTLRDGVSTNAINYLSNSHELNVGLGTVYHPDQLDGIEMDRIKFIVSPGFSLEILEFSQHEAITYIPGVETASEIIRAVNNNLNVLKFFPAETIGGISKLQAFASVFPDVKFLCTGGISTDNYKEYLLQENVISLGGSFVLPRKLLDQELNLAIDHLNNL